jgi:hypothetical protein
VFLVQSEVHPPRRRDGPLVDGLLRQIGFVCHVPSGADPRLYSVCVCVCSCVLLSLQASAIDIAELDISVQSALA